METRNALARPGQLQEVTGWQARIDFISSHFEIYTFGLGEPGSVSWFARRLLIDFERCEWRFMELAGGLTFVVPEHRDRYQTRATPGVVLSAEGAGLAISIQSVHWWQHHGTGDRPRRCQQLLSGLIAYVDQRPDGSAICNALGRLPEAST